MVRIIFAIVVMVWLVAAWAMIKMWINGIRVGDTLFPTPSVITASYNSRYFRIFAACIAAGIVACIVFNVLLFMGYITDLHIN
jgi:hypothetical protein